MKKITLFLMLFVVVTSFSQSQVILKSPKLMFYHEDTDDDGKFDFSDVIELLPEYDIEIVLENNHLRFLNSSEKEEYILLSIRKKHKEYTSYNAVDLEGSKFIITINVGKEVALFNEVGDECISYNIE